MPKNVVKPIYNPKGRAQEYCDLAVNIYDSCSHGCTYCFARDLAKRFGKPWGDTVSPRPGIAEAVRVQLATAGWVGRRIQLCFTCDPYPQGCDTTVTREVIQAIKESGNHVQILTKGDETAQRDFDLLDGNDWFGVTFSGDDYAEPGAATHQSRHTNIGTAKYQYRLNTWMSCEPVLDPVVVLSAIRCFDSVDLWKIGKLNHRKSDIDWGAFGHQVEALCRRFGRNYYIKDDLRRMMGAEAKEGR